MISFYFCLLNPFESLLNPKLAPLWGRAATFPQEVLGSTAPSTTCLVKSAKVPGLPAGWVTQGISGRREREGAGGSDSLVTFSKIRFVGMALMNKITQVLITQFYGTSPACI